MNIILLICKCTTCSPFFQFKDYIKMIKHMHIIQ